MRTAREAQRHRSIISVPAVSGRDRGNASLPDSTAPNDQRNAGGKDDQTRITANSWSRLLTSNSTIPKNPSSTPASARHCIRWVRNTKTSKVIVVMGKLASITDVMLDDTYCFRPEQRSVCQDEHAQADDRGIAPLDEGKARLSPKPHEGMQQDSSREEAHAGREKGWDLQHRDTNRQKRTAP